MLLNPGTICPNMYNPPKIKKVQVNHSNHLTSVILWAASKNAPADRKNIATPTTWAGIEAAAVENQDNCPVKKDRTTTTMKIISGVIVREGIIKNFRLLISISIIHKPISSDRNNTPA